MRVFAVILALMAALPALAEEKIRVTYPPGAPRIASDFQARLGVNGLWRGARHQGIDIIGPSGMAILAAADGKVLETDIGTCWGPTIVIDHGRGHDGERLVAAYGHLGEILVVAGDQVRRGQVIGRLGDNFRDFKCIAAVRHLHFQLGRSWRGPYKGDAWGHVKYLRDGRRGVNPHLYWTRGPGRITCFEENRNWRSGTLSYPVPCT